MGVYSAGIYGIDESTLMMHLDTARKRKNAYEKLVSKLNTILDNNLISVKSTMNDQKELFDKSYISEEGNVKKDIDSDFRSIMRYSTDLINRINKVKEEIQRRIEFYNELISSGQSAMQSSPTSESASNSLFAILGDLLPGKSEREELLEKQAKTRYNIVGSNVDWYVAD